MVDERFEEAVACQPWFATSVRASIVAQTQVWRGRDEEVSYLKNNIVKVERVRWRRRAEGVREAQARLTMLEATVAD